MTPTRPVSDRALALTLLVAAGFLDGIAYRALNGVFVAFMSGNSTVLGASTATTTWHVVALCGSMIIAFFAGNVLGNVIIRWGGARRHLGQMSVTAAWVAVGSLIATTVSPTVGLVTVAVGSGMINTTLSAGTDVHVGLTYVTGTLVKAAHQLVYGFGTADRRAWLATMFAWLVFVVGAAAGALGYQWWGLAAMWVATAVVMCAVLLPHRS